MLAKRKNYGISRLIDEIFKDFDLWNRPLWEDFKDDFRERENIIRYEDDENVYYYVAFPFLTKEQIQDNVEIEVDAVNNYFSISAKYDLKGILNIDKEVKRNFYYGYNEYNVEFENFDVEAKDGYLIIKIPKKEKSIKKKIKIK